MSGPPRHDTSASTVAIVTGASRGPGSELVGELARRGCAVVVVYLRDQAAAEAVVDGVHAAGGTALAVRADLVDELDVERLFDETTVALGAADLVVHAARCGTPVVLRQAARRLRDGGAVVSVAGPGAVGPALAEALRARRISVNGMAPGLEPPGPDHGVAELVALVDRWRGGPGP